MPNRLTAAERNRQARRAALILHSRVDSADHLAPARAAGPGSLAYWEAKVDPDGELTEAERAKRARCAKRAFYLDLSTRGVRARKKKVS